MRDFIKAMLLLLFSITILILDQHYYESDKREAEKRKNYNKQQVANKVVSGLGDILLEEPSDSLHQYLNNHDFWQANSGF